MYADVPFWLSLVFMIGGLGALAWSSDLFVVGAAEIAKALGISAFVIGMVIIGFGTSAPELCVSAISGITGHANLSLGNAYGSCSFNIAVILGVAVMIFPLVVRPEVSFVAGVGLSAVALFSLWLLRDGFCARGEACALLCAFAVLMPLYCWYDQKMKTRRGPQAAGSAAGSPESRQRIPLAAVKLVVGLAVLVGSSHLLVWGAVDFAKFCGVSDLVIGLTVVSAGTSLPELASAIASARRGEHEFVLGNIIGSNLFNMLAVVGIAAVLSPISPGGEAGFSKYILTRDLPYLIALSLSITVFGANWRHPKWPGAIRRREVLVWLVSFVAYMALMFYQEVHVKGNCN
ncbi:MAG: calcium/sodium antiporter [Kiritimatiellae bacterium]|nr:calcium/sodium antiporter [Kiritimatiellia bacterium]